MKCRLLVRCGDGFYVLCSYRTGVNGMLLHFRRTSAISDNVDEYRWRSRFVWHRSSLRRARSRACPATLLLLPPHIFALRTSLPMHGRVRVARGSPSLEIVLGDLHRLRRGLHSVGRMSAGLCYFSLLFSLGVAARRQWNARSGRTRGLGIFSWLGVGVGAGFMGAARGVNQGMATGDNKARV